MKRTIPCYHLTETGLHAPDGISVSVPESQWRDTAAAAALVKSHVKGQTFDLSVPTAWTVMRTDTLPAAKPAQRLAAARLRASRLFHGLGEMAMDVCWGTPTADGVEAQFWGVPEQRLRPVLQVLKDAGARVRTVRPYAMLAAGEPVDGVCLLEEPDGQVTALGYESGHLRHLRCLGALASSSFKVRMQAARPENSEAQVVWVGTGSAPEAIQATRMRPPAPMPSASNFDLAVGSLSAAPTAWGTERIRVAALSGAAAVLGGLLLLAAWQRGGDRLERLKMNNQREAERLELTRQRRDALSELSVYFSDRPRPRAIMMVVADAMPDPKEAEQAIRLIRYEERDGRDDQMVIEVEAANAAAMFAFQERLLADARLARAEMGNLDPEQRGTAVRTEITLTGAGDAS